MTLGISALKDALKARLGDRQRVSLETRRLGVDAIAQFGAPGCAPSLDWRDFQGLRAALFAPAQPSGSGCILYVHGGAFVAGSPRSHAYLTTNMAHASGLPVYALDYRLAPEHPFPAAVDDVIAAVRYLAHHHGGHDQVALAGDSAGGTLALLAAQRLQADRRKLRAVAVISPVVDLACEGETYRTHADRDPFISQDGLKQDIACFLADAPTGRRAASPIHGNFSGFPPLLIQVGSEEVLLGDALALEKVVRACGGAVTLRVWPDMIHVWHLFPHYLAEADAAIAEIAHFIAAGK